MEQDMELSNGAGRSQQRGNDGRGGRGGRGGQGGSGGKGGGDDGDPGEDGGPGEPGETGERSIVSSNGIEMRTPWFVFNLGTILTVVLSCIGGIIWLVQMDGKVDGVQKTQFGRDNGIALRSELDAVRNRQIEIFTRLEKFDAGGTQALAIVRERVTQLASEVAGQNTRCQDLNRVVAEIQRKVIEIDVQMNTQAQHFPRERRN